MFRKLALLLCMTTLGLTAGPRRQIVSPTGHQLQLPFSPGVLSGDFLYVSGTLGNRPGTLEVQGDVRTQTRKVLENIGEVLRQARLGFSDVVSANVYLADMRDFEAMNEEYRTFFLHNPPTRATVEGGLVVREALVEISVVASNAGKPQSVVPAGWQIPSSPYSYGLQVGHTLFVSGMVSEDPALGRLVPGDASVQSKQALDNLGRVLKTAQMDFGDVLGCRVYLADSRDFQAMNEVFKNFFQTAPPVRATVNARLALPSLRVEMQCTASNDRSRKVVGTSAPGRPFSPAIQVGDKLYVAGMVGRGRRGFAAGDVSAQTRQTLLNIQEALRAGGLDFEDIVDATVYLTDVRQYAEMNAVYREMIPGSPPARATTAVGLMSADALVEIMVTAVQR